MVTSILITGLKLHTMPTTCTIEKLVGESAPNDVVLIFSWKNHPIDLLDSSDLLLEYNTEGPYPTLAVKEVDKGRITAVESITYTQAIGLTSNTTPDFILHWLRSQIEQVPQKPVAENEDSYTVF